MTSKESGQSASSLIVHIVGDSEIKAFSITLKERIEIQLGRAGLTVSDDINKADMLLAGDCIYGMSVLKALQDAPSDVLLLDDEGRIAGIRCDDEGKTAAVIGEETIPEGYVAKSGAELAGRYDQLLRKRTDPTVLVGRDRVTVEKSLFKASYKGVTDFVTKHVWPAPALIVTRWCASLKITPNQVTFVSAIFVIATFYLFWHGHFGLGLVTAWIMTFLDTVDGKLARVTLTSSKFGNIFDHGIDMVHPPFWWWAFAVGLTSIGEPLGYGGLALGLIVVGYVLQRIEEGIFIIRYGIQMHIWRPFDSFFRQITARRNPNLVILTLATLIGYPREGLLLVALWTGLCLIVHLLQIIQAQFVSRKAPIDSWLAKE